ncbi:MAG: flagellar biosynthesis anti-sigma factor FlgM [Pseudomonadota bacterium]|jgi:negative regulator of flagellin synthesis FlgM|nr:negative regulator of flagellin synthesis FlgM [Pseudomonadota bacterium]
MMIGNSNPLNTSATTPVTPAASQARPETSAPREATPPAPSAGLPDGAADSTSVQMSETSATLREGGTADASEFDTEKVQRMRLAISSGVYRVNAEAIADKLLANAQDLLGQIGTGR